MSYSYFLSRMKCRLASMGPVRPQAWIQIESSCRLIELNTSESLIQEPGMLIFVANGLLKEYDARKRLKPAIINFITTDSFIVTTTYRQYNYVKAICRSTLISMRFEEAIALYVKYKELLMLYDSIAVHYEEGVSFRYALLEERLIKSRIQAFIYRYKAIIPFLKKKDIANYLHIEYDYFIRQYGKLL